MPTDRERMTNEMKTATLIRSIMRSVSESQVNTIYELFDSDINNESTGTPAQRSCAKWYKKINKHFRTIPVIMELNAIIEICLDLGIDLDKDPEFSPAWKQLMRMHWSPQTILKIRTYTQVPQMAAQDESKYEPGEETEEFMPFEKLDTS
jgi:hypothetical protein